MERRETLLTNKRRLIAYISKRFGEKITSAFEKVRREDFVLEEYRQQAYEDNALPLIYGQTISQPSTIAYMLAWLELNKGQKVLEIGAGSGYNAALISCIIGKEGKVYSIEIVKQVAELAKKNIKKAGIDNVYVINADGSDGYKKEKPYDRIIITAACLGIPSSFTDQLKNNGILVAPVGAGYQKMVKLRKKGKKIIREESMDEYLFVPLVRQTGKIE